MWPYFLKFLGFFLFSIQTRCISRRNKKLICIPCIASKSTLILLSLGWTSIALLREDDSHIFFFNIWQTYFAWSLIWLIYSTVYFFFLAQVALSKKSISWQYKALIAFVHDTIESNTVVYSMVHCLRNLDRRIRFIFNKKLLLYNTS